jgi:hypothetical protein
MKKIFQYALMLMVGTIAMTSCSEDRDSNPTLVTPSALVLNETNWRGSTVELESTTDSLILSWAQPQLTTDNAPVVVSYKLDISLRNGAFTTLYNASADDNSAADYMTYDQTITTNSIKLGASELNRLSQQFFGWTSAADVPYRMPITFRVRASVLNASNNPVQTVTSNLVSITVLPYFVLLKPADPEIWYLIGADICDGSWGEDVAVKTMPLQTIENETYNATTGQGKIQWIGYLAGNGFKLRGSLSDGWATQWGQGESFGTFVKNDGGSGNITVPAPGLYTVTLNTESDQLAIEAYTGSAPVRAGMAIAGSFNGWSDTPMQPCFTNGSENHDWYIEYTFAAGDEVKVKEAGTWDFNKGGTFNTLDDGSLTVYGVDNGANLVIPENATYTIIFNDITGFIRFIKK